jgi:hypothetical protein
MYNIAVSFEEKILASTLETTVHSRFALRPRCIPKKVVVNQK